MAGESGGDGRGRQAAFLSLDFESVATPSDTIAAIASARGRGSVGVIRVSGAEARHVAESLLGEVPAPREARLRRFKDAHGAVLDAGVALYFPGPASFTGEDVLELQGHGGLLVLDLLLSRVLELGCRLARPGEFSERAFMNGKMDVTQAEAVADLIDAGTAAAARAAARSMQGEFSARVAQLRSRLIGLRAYVEAAIDFPDEEIDFLSNPAIAERLTQVFAEFDAITAAARQGALLRDGLTVVIAGEPNAGKSSLLNRLVGEDVAIVTAVPGTTRDVLRQRVHIDGMPLHLVDTAGLRQAADVVEAEGIRRARVEIRRADLVLYVIDGSTLAGKREAALHVPAQWQRELEGIALTRVLNKMDVPGTDWPGTEVPSAAGESSPLLRVSARTGAGFDTLRTHLKERAGYEAVQGGTFSARRRHLDALRRARGFVDTAVQVLGGAAFELFAEELRLAQHALGEITGEFTSEDLLAEIFGSFCIGK